MNMTQAEIVKFGGIHIPSSCSVAILCSNGDPPGLPQMIVPSRCTQLAFTRVTLAWQTPQAVVSHKILLARKVASGENTLLGQAENFRMD